MGWDDNKPNERNLPTLPTSTIEGVVGWDGLGQKQTKRQQTADTTNIHHGRGGGMGWAGTKTNPTTAKRGGGMGWGGTITSQTTANCRHYQHRPWKGWWDGMGRGNNNPNDSKQPTLPTSTNDSKQPTRNCAKSSVFP